MPFERTGAILPLPIESPAATAKPLTVQPSVMAARHIRKEGLAVTEPDQDQTHEDRFRCPQCDRIVTVTARYHRAGDGGDALVQFDCTMQGMCGSPIWDPCPMYVAYMEKASAERDPAELG